MTQETQSQLFIRLLREARLQDRREKKTRWTLRSRETAKKFQQLFMTDPTLDVLPALPADCVDLMDARHH